MLADGVGVQLGPIASGGSPWLAGRVPVRGTHDYAKPELPLLRPRPYHRQRRVDRGGRFIGPGVTIGDKRSRRAGCDRDAAGRRGGGKSAKVTARPMRAQGGEQARDDPAHGGRPYNKSKAPRPRKSQSCRAVTAQTPSRPALTLARAPIAVFSSQGRGEEPSLRLASVRTGAGGFVRSAPRTHARGGRVLRRTFHFRPWEGYVRQKNWGLETCRHRPGLHTRRRRVDHPRAAMSSRASDEDSARKRVL